MTNLELLDSLHSKEFELRLKVIKNNTPLIKKEYQKILVDIKTTTALIIGKVEISKAYLEVENVCSQHQIPYEDCDALTYSNCDSCPLKDINSDGCSDCSLTMIDNKNVLEHHIEKDIQSNILEAITILHNECTNNKNCDSCSLFINKSCLFVH